MSRRKVKVKGVAPAGLDFGDRKGRGVEEEPVDEDIEPQKQPRATVSQDLSAFYKRGRFGDVTFLLSPELEDKKGPVAAKPADEKKAAEQDPLLIAEDGFVHLRAHRAILAARSPVFEAMLYPCTPDERAPLPRTIEIKDVKPSVFRSLLRCIYSGDVELSPENISELIRVAQKYQVEDISRQCQIFLKKGISVSNSCLWYSQALPGSAERRSALNVIEDHTAKVVKTKGFLSLAKKDLQEILQSNLLNIDELELFDAVVQWGEAELERTGMEDTPDNRRTAIVSCLAFIRFPLMKLEDVVSKIAPSKILPADDLLQLYTYISAKPGAKPPFHLHYDTRPRTPRRPVSFFRFDPDFKHAGVTVADEGLLAINSSSSGSWQSVMGSMEFKPRTGVYEWTCVLEVYNTTNSYNVLVGVAPVSSFDPRTAATPAGYNTRGWTFITGQGQLASGSVSSAFGVNVMAQCKQGDRVQIRLDTDKGTISFSKNGRSLGLSLSGVSGPVRPVVSMVQNQRVRLQFTHRADEEE